MLPDFSGLSLQCAPTGDAWSAANGPFPAAGAEWTPAQRTWLGTATCAVCLDALSDDANGPPLILCANRHVYHRDCAQGLVDRFVTRCPECSQAITAGLTPTPLPPPSPEELQRERERAEREEREAQAQWWAMEPWEREEAEQEWERERAANQRVYRALAQRRMWARYRRQQMRYYDRERGDRADRARVRARERAALDTPREHQPLAVFAPNNADY